MIRSFEWIKNCGNWSSYQWDDSLQLFGRINLVYGPNGSGKTSLSGALDGLKNAEDQKGFERVSIVLSDDESTRKTDGSDDPAFGRIMVFSDQYVARSHSFTPGESSLDAVLTIGERSVEIENQLLDLGSRLEVAEREYQSQSQKATTSRRSIDRTYREVSEKVVTAANRAGGRWQSRGRFSAGSVRTAYDGSRHEWQLLSDTELRQRISHINSDNTDKIETLNLSLNVPGGFAPKLNALLSASPTTVILDTLTSHPEATNWVDDGRNLHSQSNVCVFCGSALTLERKHLIDQHFSDEVERLQVSLSDILNKLSNLSVTSSTAKLSVPNRSLFFEDLRQNADEEIKALNLELDRLRDWIADATKKAEAKTANILAPVDLSIMEPPTVAGLGMESLIKQHNDRVTEHESMVQKAARSVEFHYLKESEQEVEASLRAEKSALDEMDRLEKILLGLRAETAALESADADPTPSAKVLTREVARLLGRNELIFNTVDGKYSVRRGGEPAVGLSMGERTAITLVHFLEAVAHFDSSKGKPIVVIDDPVSSLDSNVFMGVSTYIWSEAVSKDHIAQLFLLTHNFELFRQWDIQIDGLPGNGGMKSKFPSSVYEIRSEHFAVHGSDSYVRHPRLVNWPTGTTVRKKMRSTYQHAFITVVHAFLELKKDDSYERQLDAQLLFPNVIRRILETFLAFKRPESVGNLTEAMRSTKEMLEQVEYDGDADALRLHLTRYVHAHSHSESPSTDTNVSPDEITTAIVSVFEFMSCIDPDHFIGLCRVADVDPLDLVPNLHSPQ